MSEQQDIVDIDPSEEIDPTVSNIVQLKVLPAISESDIQLIVTNCTLVVGYKPYLQSKSVVEWLINYLDNGLINVTSGTNDAGMFYLWRGNHWEQIHDADIEHDLIWIFNKPRQVAEMMMVLRCRCRVPRKMIDGIQNKIYLKSQVLTIHNGQVQTSPHCRENYNTCAIDMTYDPANTNHPKFAALLKQILPDPMQRDLLQEIFGYCLVKSLDYQVFFCFPGEPGSGKSTILEMLTFLLGGKHSAEQGKTISPYITARSLSTLGDKNGTTGLELALVNLASECQFLSQKDEAILKRISGGDPIMVEYKFQTAFTVSANPKFIIATNSLPTFSDRSDAIFQRLVCLDFNQQVDMKKMISNVAGKIWQSESTAILTWAINGLLRLIGGSGMRNARFTMPDSSRATIDQNRCDSNPAVDWFNQRIVADENSSVDKQTAFDDFIAFCSAQNIPSNHPLRQYNPYIKAVNHELRRLKITQPKDSRRYANSGERVRVFKGVRLITTAKNKTNTNYNNVKE